MKLLIIVAIIFTVGLMFFKYSKDKNIQKLIVSLLSFGIIISMAVVGNLTRPVIPIYIAHMILIIFAWIALIWYILKSKYYWWIIFLPVVSIGLFLLLELLAGSANELN